jgi:hypothetical protein
MVAEYSRTGKVIREILTRDEFPTTESADAGSRRVANVRAFPANS